MQRTLAILRRLLASGNWWTLLAIGVALPAADARGDGGTLQISQRCGEFQVSVFTSPAVLRVGPIDVSVLVQDAATQHIRDDVPVTVRVESVDEPARGFQQPATQTAATNRLLKAAIFEIPRPGAWRVRVSPASAEEPASISFHMQVAPPSPAWLQLAPWVGGPLVVVPLFVVHQHLARRGRSGRPGV